MACLSSLVDQMDYLAFVKTERLFKQTLNKAFCKGAFRNPADLGTLPRAGSPPRADGPALLLSSLGNPIFWVEDPRCCHPGNNASVLITMSSLYDVVKDFWGGFLLKRNYWMNQPLKALLLLSVNLICPKPYRFHHLI